MTADQKLYNALQTVCSPRTCSGWPTRSEIGTEAFVEVMTVTISGDAMTPTGSRQDLPHHLAMHIGQPEVAAGVAVGEPGVVEAEQVQDRGVQVVDVHGVLDGLVAEFVGRAVDVPPLTPPPASQTVKPQ